MGQCLETKYTHSQTDEGYKLVHSMYCNVLFHLPIVSNLNSQVQKASPSFDSASDTIVFYKSHHDYTIQMPDYFWNYWEFIQFYSARKSFKPGVFGLLKGEDVSKHSETWFQVSH